jgi:Flp pilus assembly pilin Flp
MANMRLASAFAADERGAVSVEYCILAVGVAVAIAATVFALGPIVGNLFTGLTFTRP